MAINTSLRPRIRPDNNNKQVTGTQRLTAWENFGDIEFKSDLKELLDKDPIAALGFDAAKTRYTLPQEIQNAYYMSGRKGSRYAEDGTYIGEQDDVVYGPAKGSSKDIIVHEYRHRGHRILQDAYFKDKEGFTKKYGQDVVDFLTGKFEEIADGPLYLGDRWEEFRTELGDNLDATYIRPRPNAAQVAQMFPDMSELYSKEELENVGQELYTQLVNQADEPYNLSPELREELLDKLVQGSVLKSTELVTKEDQEKYKGILTKVRQAASNILKERKGYDKGGLATQMDSLFDAEGRRRRKDRPVVEEARHPLESVPFFDRPISASTRDQIKFIDLEGNAHYETVLGETYTIKRNPDQRNLRQKFQDDALPAIEAYLKDPTLPTKEQVVGVGKAVYEGIKETASIPGDMLTAKRSPAEITMMDVADLSGMVTLGSIPFKVPEGAIRLFGGASAKKLDIKNFAKAEKLYEDGLDPESIRKETGWFKDDVDRKWRFEIDDSKLKLTGEDYPGIDFSDSSGQDAWYNYIDEINENRLDDYSMGGDGSVTLKLKDFLNHDELYKRYPQLKDYTIQVGAELDSGVLGTFSSNSKTIELSGQLQDIDELKDVLVHEVQHAVQSIEGFLPGSNQAESAYLALSKFKDETKDVIKKLESYGYKIPTILDDTKPYKDNMTAALDNPSGTFYSFSQQKPNLTESQKYSADKYLKRFEDLTKKISDVKAFEYQYYRNRSGEIEANLVEKRRDFTEEQRKLYSPISGKQGQITRPQAYRVADSVIEARQGQSDILVDLDLEYLPSKNNPNIYNYNYKGKEYFSYDDVYDVKIRDFLKSNKDTKKLAGLKIGDTVTLNSDGREYFFVGFRPYTEMIRRLDKNYPHVFHEAMDDGIEVDNVAGVTLVRIPRGTTKKQRKEIIKFIEDPPVEFYIEKHKTGTSKTTPENFTKFKEFSLGDLIFNSNKSTAKPEATASFRDASDTDSGFLNKIGFSGGGLVRE